MKGWLFEKVNKIGKPLGKTGKKSENINYQHHKWKEEIITLHTLKGNKETILITLSTSY